MQLYGISFMHPYEVCVLLVLIMYAYHNALLRKRIIYSKIVVFLTNCVLFLGLHCGNWLSSVVETDPSTARKKHRIW
jgi:hypothetical protein